MRGKVEKIKNKEGKKPFAFVVNGVWYNTYNVDYMNIKEGALIDFEYEENEKGFKHLTSLKFIDNGIGTPIEQTNKHEENNLGQEKIRLETLTRANGFLQVLASCGKLNDLSVGDIIIKRKEIAENDYDWVKQ